MKKSRCWELAVILSIFLGTTAISLPAQTLTTLYSFCSQSNCADGQYPLGRLVQATDGNFYGTTFGGGGGWGTVFKITPQGSLTVLHGLTGQQDGAEPYAGVIQASDGNFYGVDTIGGGTPSGCGAVFKVTPSGTTTSLHGFAGYYYGDSCNPWPPLVQASDGNLYGTSYGGGSSNVGTVFRITTSGTLTILHNFTGPDGGIPVGGLVEGTDGYLYGTTSVNGANNYGTVFKMTLAGALTTLYSFKSTDGSTPTGTLVQASDGNFYGTTNSGGANNYGTVFQMTPNGTLTTLYSFCHQSFCPDGSSPYAGLMQASDGNLYGTTYRGGNFSQGDTHGTVFTITPTGAFANLYNFCSQANCADGAYPYAGLIQATDGKLYGVTKTGGTMYDGTVFSLTLPELFALSVNTVGSGTVTSSDGHINCGTTCSYLYNKGNQVTLTATPAQGWVFTGWSGCDGVNGNVCTVAMNYPRNVAATFTIGETLSITLWGSGTVTGSDGYINCGLTCSHLYASGAQVTLTATPAQGWSFSSWSGCDVVNGNVCTVTLYTNRNVTATFLPLDKLSVSITGSGTVTSSDGHINCGTTCSYMYANGTQIRLTATPAQGWGFTSWSGCDAVNGNICTVNIHANRTVTATFSVLYKLSVSVSGNGTVVSGNLDCGSICSQLYPQGMQVRLTALPAPGSTLSGWTGCDGINGDLCTLTMSGPRNVTATFAIVQVTMLSLTLKPASVTSGLLSIATLTLGAPAPAGGVGVRISSDNMRYARPPALVEVPGGAISVRFGVRTYPVGQQTVVQITATANASHTSATLTLNPR